MINLYININIHQRLKFMKNIKKYLLIIFLIFIANNLYAAASDEVSTASQDFETTGVEDEIYDPLEPVNRAIFKFNNVADKVILEPVAKGYKKLPSPVQTGISNFLGNLKMPLVFVNQLLQGQGKNAAESTGRFLVNSTAGVFGLIDVADKIGLEEKEEDFGQTLATWGVGDGFYIVLPLFGPSNLRDMLSLYPDMQMDPIYYVENRSYNIPQPKGELSGYSRKTLQSAQLTILKTINRESLRIGQYQDLKKDAIELYPFLRDVYEQNRAKLIEE